jgi:hypothetical protein
MFHRTSSGFRRARVQADQRRIRAAAIMNSPATPVEALEQRIFLSLSAQALAGPVSVVGNSWTYELDSGSTTIGTETLTSKGTVTHNGVSAIEIDVTGTSASGGTAPGTAQIFYAFLPQGYVALESITTTSKGAVDDSVWSPPYHLIIPSTLSANVPVTTPTATATDTTTPADKTIAPTTGTSTKSDVITLKSETPNVSVKVNAGTYIYYEIDSTETYTAAGSAPTTDMTQTFVSPTQGLVEVKDLTVGSTMQLTNFTGTTFKLAVTTQSPTSVVVDDKINPAVRVSLQDSSGATDTNAADAVTITPSIDPASTGTGTLSGATPVTTVRGVANFSDLSIDKSGQYVLDFLDSNGRTVSSNSFQVTGGKLRFKGRVSNGIAGSALEPAVEVELVNSKNKPIIDASSLVTLTISGTNSSNPITGFAAQLVNGFALFSSLKLGAPGNYTLNATDDQSDTSILSNTFEITGVHLAFRKQPKEAGVNAPLQYEIVVEDSRKRLVNTSSIGLGLTLNTVEGGANARLSDTSDTVDFGTAKNSGANPAAINSPGTYTITFTVISQDRDAFDYTIDPITSDPFQIVANHLAFAKEPSTVFVNDPLHYEVELKDFKNHTITTNSSDQLMFTLNTPPGSEAILTSGLDSLVTGIANNSGNTPLSIDSTGTYSLSVVDVPANPADAVATSVKSKSFRVILPKKTNPAAQR